MSQRVVRIGGQFYLYNEPPRRPVVFQELPAALQESGIKEEAGWLVYAGDVEGDVPPPRAALRCIDDGPDIPKPEPMRPRFSGNSHQRRVARRRAAHGL